MKVTSITVDVGVLCWAWVEESYEILSEDDFDMLDESIRGEVPNGLFKQITLTLNPWNEKHWIKHRFYDEKVLDENGNVKRDSEGRVMYKARETAISHDGEILAITTNYTCNEWLDDADKRVFERMKINNPKRYQVAGLGNWGIVDGLVYDNWREERFDIYDSKFKREHPNLKSAFGLDFGYTNDPTALFCGFIDQQNKKIFVYDELYEKGLTNQMIYSRISEMGYSKERIIGDSAEPKSIAELNGYGLRIKGAKKGKDSVNNGIQFIQDYEIIIHPRCVNFLTEIQNYTWSKDKFGKKLNVPIDDFNHLMDAMRYALEQYINVNNWIY